MNERIKLDEEMISTMAERAENLAERLSVKMSEAKRKGRNVHYAIPTHLSLLLITGALYGPIVVKSMSILAKGGPVSVNEDWVQNCDPCS